MKEIILDFIYNNIIAIITLIVAGFTLWSQLKTQKNTRSLVQPREAITSYLSQCYLKFLFIESRLYSVEKCISKYGNNVKYSDSLFTGLNLDINDFNINMFYEDQRTYSRFSQFKDVLSELNEKVESLNIDLQNSSFNEKQLNSILAETKNFLIYSYRCWYALFIHAINYRKLKFWSRFIIDKLVYRIILRFKYKQYSRDNDNNLSFIERHAMNVQEIFEKSILSIIEDSGWYIVSDLYEDKKKVGSGLLDNKKTITCNTLNKLDKFWYDEIELEIYESKDEVKVEWNHYSLCLINDEKRKSLLGDYLDLICYALDKKFKNMISLSQLDGETVN